MRLAIISDIHSNLEALTKAFEIIDQRSVDEIVCLGDIIGYGANPNECVELIRQRCGIVIKGNHENAVLNAAAAERFSDNARSAIVWTRSQLTEEHLAYFRTLPLSQLKEDLLFVHASPCFPEEWNYIFDEDAAARSFRCFSEPLGFIGHTHVPAIFSSQGQDFKITKEERFLINVGRVGQSRDRNIHLSFGLIDTDMWTYENIRSAYDVQAAVWKILKTPLPSKLGHRLLMGV
jgi:diadenosine tetraphosphatase ApaH/serine/threonine PP2A family protein phosphatase